MQSPKVLVATLCLLSAAMAAPPRIAAEDSFERSKTVADGESNPATIVIDYQEAGSGLNIESSSRSILDGNQLEVAGTWANTGANQLVFTPAAALAESYYIIALQLVDSLGNQGATAQYHFTVDMTPPPVPEVHCVPPVR